MALLLITGAGASRRLGVADDLPLMPDWADALCSALDAVEHGLANVCGLSTGMTGEAFEQALGLLLRWQQVRHLEERFAGLGGDTLGQQAEPLILARRAMDERLGRIKHVLNETLYEQFGQERVSDEKAVQAYEALLGHFDARELMVATTNYDRAGEAALTGLGHNVDTGFRAAPGRTPRLSVAGLVETKGVVPYIHLHGAVGWYELNGDVRDHAADQPFNQTLGSPVVLYPDPEKDPTNDAVVSALWMEFHKALDLADHVLIMGHSLHDPALVNAIRLARPRKLAITMFGAGEEAKWAKRQLPSAIMMEMDFGPELSIDMAALTAFRG